MKTRALGLGALAAAGAIVASRALAAAMRYDLEGKTVLVVGGSRGLGLQIAREAALRGARIGLCARSAEELENARHEFMARGSVVATSACDIREYANVERTVREIEERLGPVDVLFNVAGIIEVGPEESQTLDDYRDAMATNFFGALHAVEAVLPGMRARGAGRIVNVTSIGGKVAVPHLLPYCASKFALVGYSEGLRAELARDGIVVTTIVPGLMRTGSPPNATFTGQREKEYALFITSDSLPFVTVSVEHAARVVVRACERGDVETVISLPARIATLAHAIAPSLVTRAMGLVGRVLPDGAGRVDHALGRESESRLSETRLTAPTRHAMQTQNQMIGPPSASGPPA